MKKLRQKLTPLLFFLFCLSQNYACKYSTKNNPATVSQIEKIESILSTISEKKNAYTKGMIWINGGAFDMGCKDCKMPDALPLHRVQVSGFWMDETPVTNKEFMEFVEETGYKTVAEQLLSQEEFPELAKEDLGPGSAVFVSPSSSVDLNNPTDWWRFVLGANWCHPEGEGSNIINRFDHPVVHICYQDALAFCKWAGKRLPTEAEFEFAAKGGQSTIFPWGNELKPKGKWAANIWQGQFPNKNKMEDGFKSTSPVKTFPPNPYGLYDMGGNVWQWCSDWYSADYYDELKEAGGTALNPTGPGESYDPNDPNLQKKVQKGGSFLCSDQYCTRYFLGSRGKGEIFSASSNLGFRCVK